MAESLTSDERAQRRYGKKKAAAADPTRSEIAANYSKLAADTGSADTRAKAARDAEDVSSAVPRKGDDD